MLAYVSGHLYVYLLRIPEGSTWKDSAWVPLLVEAAVIWTRPDQSILRNSLKALPFECKTYCFSSSLSIKQSLSCNFLSPCIFFVVVGLNKSCSQCHQFLKFWTFNFNVRYNHRYFAPFFCRSPFVCFHCYCFFNNSKTLLYFSYICIGCYKMLCSKSFLAKFIKVHWGRMDHFFFFNFVSLLFKVDPFGVDDIIIEISVCCW